MKTLKNLLSAVAIVLLMIETQEKPEMMSVVNMTGSEVFYSEDCQETCLAGRLNHLFSSAEA